MVGESGEAVEDVGEGAGDAVGEVGQGAGQAVGDVGQGAGQAVGNLDQLGANVGKAAGQLGQGAGQAGGGLGDLGGPLAPDHGTRAKEAAKLAAKELGAATQEKVKQVGEKRRQKKAEKHHATEAALRVAEELDVDLDDVDGSGADGRITVADVRAAGSG